MQSAAKQGTEGETVRSYILADLIVRDHGCVCVKQALSEWMAGA